jgi:hypothetical protein
MTRAKSTTSKNAWLELKSTSEGLGLLANGSSGQWEVSIDEATTGKDQWFAQVEGPAISFSFEIPSVDILEEMLRFFKSQPKTVQFSHIHENKRKNFLLINKDKKTPINLVKDDEYPDRYFLVIGKKDNPIVRFVLSSKDIEEIAEALRQVEEDLKDGD